MKHRCLTLFVFATTAKSMSRVARCTVRSKTSCRVDDPMERALMRSLARGTISHASGVGRGEGIEAAVIQAVRSTSAPLCWSLGFEEVCSQKLYAWSPE